MLLHKFRQVHKQKKDSKKRQRKSLRGTSFVLQSIPMEPRSAAEHLQVIRTLMERSALYRRALAPIMMFVGGVGLIAAVLSWGLHIGTAAAFIGYWYVVGAAALTGAFLLVRRQAWQQAEPFWSSPTRRVALAMIPPLTGGCLLGLLAMVVQFRGGDEPELSQRVVLISLPAVWVVLYGCALHAAGFYTTRGMRLFGWVLIVVGCGALLALRCPDPAAILGNTIMGFSFGGLHLAYGVYLYFTEQRGNEM